jgi:pSer/pThr/pTyr-binding forkhead associated (FHA) protein
MHPKKRMLFGWMLSLVLICGIIGGLFPVQSAFAQESSGKIVLNTINTDSFPAMGVDFEAYDPTGSFIADLQTGDVLINEAGNLLPADSLELLKPGVEITLAFNLSPELTNRYAGVTRMANILDRLQQWTQALPVDSPDQVSLATNTGLQLIRSQSRQELASALTDLGNVDLSAEKSSLNALTRAVDLATDPNTQRSVKRAILYVTPLPGLSSLAALPNLAERALHQNTPIFVWLVASASSPASNPDLYSAIEKLAQDSGGSVFLYNGEGALPDPDGYFNPLRYVYRAAYTSRIQAGGSYDIRLEVQRNGVQLYSEVRPVFMTVLAPNPIFLSPPSTIERVWLKKPDSTEESLQPQSEMIQIVVEFSDGHTRPLRSSRLYVDGALAVENTREPFDSFRWDLSGYTAAGRHVLVAEVEDTLGLTRRSIETPVDITVEPVKANVIKSIFSGTHVLIFGGVLAAGVVLVLALGLVGRRAQQNSPASRRAREDPLTQPVTPHTDGSRPDSPVPGVDRPTWPRYAIGSLSSAPAWLLRIPDTGGLSLPQQSQISPSSNPASAIPLSRRETRLGSDAQAVTYKISSPTVSPLHARITQTAEGGFLIQDTGSVAGTWVNYAPVPAQGILLHHNDLVQIGKVAFRFELANPPEERQPRITNYQEPQ